MGAGASSAQGMQNLIATTMIIGRAIAVITFPGMFRIYDFHSKKAPKVKIPQRNFTLFGYVSDDEEDEEQEVVDPSNYSHLFHVQVGEDKIYLDDVLAVNEAGWCVLHTCCMSLATVQAGIAIINEIVRLGGNLDQKTISGPGTFNKGWTPLHMACAYGIEPIVEKLVEEGADVNTINSFGFTPLYEVCHRGYSEIIVHLLKSKHIDLDYIPSDESVQESPFTSVPAQSALGEASRAGFAKIAQMLIDAGADKNKRNNIGWTPLHEACFYNRVEVVKVLLLAGASPIMRTKMGALPYHLAGFQVLKDMIADMGGPGSKPEEGDIIDMMMILKELSMISESEGNGTLQIIDTGFDDEHNNHSSTRLEPQVDEPVSPDVKARSLKSSAMAKSTSTNQFIPESKSYEESRDTVLHSGPLLGTLPSLQAINLSSPKSSVGSPNHRPFGAELDSLLGNVSNKHGQIMSSDLDTVAPSKKADSKMAKKKATLNADSDAHDDTPSNYKCSLTQRLMTEPVKSVYGHVYEKSAILSWFSQQGRICPLTGAPLSDSNLKPLPDLADEIRNWILKRSMAKTNEDKPTPGVEAAQGATTIKSKALNDDLYDF